MTLLVVGSTAFDTVETPHGTAKDCLGGSSTYFALAARLFTKVRLVSVVGQDFPAEHRQLLTQHGIDIAGLEEKPGKTFRWHGRYSADMNSRITIDVQLNTFGSFQPKVPNSFQDSPFVFLANGAPATQLSVLQQMHAPKFIVADTMDLWIERERDGLLELLRKVHGVILNDAEAKQLTGESNLIKAGKRSSRLTFARYFEERGARLLPVQQLFSLRHSCLPDRVRCRSDWRWRQLCRWLHGLS